MTRSKEKSGRNEKAFVHEFFDTAGMADFTFRNVGPPPRDYPTATPDRYSARPFAGTYRQRREALIDHCLANPAGPNIKGYYYELVRIACDRGPVHESLIEAALDYIDERRDCSDFVMLGIVRLLYQLKGKRLCSRRLLDHAERTLLGFKYDAGGARHRFHVLLDRKPLHHVRRKPVPGGQALCSTASSPTPGGVAGGLPLGPSSAS